MVDASAVHGWIVASLDAREDVRKPAEAALNAAGAAPTEFRAPFYQALLQVSAHASVDGAVRLAALLCLKRLIGGAPAADPAMAAVRESALALLLDASSAPPQLALQAALTVARLARADFPWRWPGLVDALRAAAAADGDAGRSLRACCGLHYVAKAVASRRMPAAVRYFRSVASELLEVARSELSRHVARAQHAGAADDQRAAIFCSRLARTVILHGIEAYAQSESARAFLSDCINALVSLSALVDSAGDATPLFAKDLLCSLAKTVMKAQKSRPHEFAPFLGPFLGFFFALVVRKPLSQSAAIEKLLISGMRFLKGVTNNSAEHGYRLDLWRPVNQTPPAGLKEGDAIVRAFFTRGVIGEFVAAMVRVHLVMTRAELEECASDPESFIAEDEELDAWKFSRRACAENVFMTFMERFPTEFVAPLSELLSSALQAPPHDLPTVLAKDAVYSAVGLGAFELVGSVHFEDAIGMWIRELSAVTDRGMLMIMRRRVAWLLGNILVVGMEQPPLELAYRCIVSLLADQELSVAFAAAASLRSLVDGVFFSGEDFGPYAIPCLAALFSLLLDRTTETSSKIRILRVVVVVLQQAGTFVVQSASSVAEGLARLWISSVTSSETAVRTQVLAAMASLISAVGSLGLPAILPSVLPLVLHSRSAECVDSEVLLEDALDLWQSVVQTAPEITDDMLAMCTTARLAEVFVQTTDRERLLAASAIACAYIFGAGQRFTEIPAANDVFSAIGVALDDLNEEGIECVLRPLNALLKLPPSTTLPHSTCDLLGKLVAIAQPQSPQSGRGRATNGGFAAILHILGRAIARDGGQFMLSVCSRGSDTATGIALLSGIATSFIEAFDSIGTQKIRKVICVALCDLLPLCFPQVDPDELIGTIACSIDPLSADPNAFMEAAQGATGSAEARGTMELTRTDPILRADIRARLRTRFSEARTHHGAAFEESVSASVIVACSPTAAAAAGALL